MKLALIIFLCAISTILAKHHHPHQHKSHQYSHLLDILNFKQNFFTKTNKHIHNIVNKMFDLVRLPEQFINQTIIKTMLTMHYDLNNIAEQNFEIYEALRNVTTIEIGNESANIIRLDELVKEVLNKNLIEFYKEIKDKQSNLNIRNTSIQHSHASNPPLPGFNDSREFKEFINGFIRKIKRLTVGDLLKKKDSSKQLPSDRNNLKVWVPPKNIEPDWPAYNTENRRIFRGKRTNIFTFPFVVSIHILRDFTCAGSIIGRDLVLTAASCVQIHYNNRYFRENPKTTFVRLGSDWTSRRGEIVSVTEIYFYPAYDPRTLKHNLAVLRLVRCIKFQRFPRTKIKRIQIDRGDGNLPVNTREVVILGWGAKKPNQVVNMFEKLTVSFLDIYPIDECRKAYSKEFVTENNFCAGFMSKGSGACNRDVGAPGVVGGYLVGVVSFGSPICGAVDAPTVYTRVGHYRDWLEPIIENRPPKHYKAKTTKMTSKALVYYFNTLSTRSYPRLQPITKAVRPSCRAQDKSEPSEEDVLHAILSDIAAKNDTIIDDILTEDLNSYFEDIFNFTSDYFSNIDEHPLINHSLYLIPGIHYNTNSTTQTTVSIGSTYIFDMNKIETTTELILRITDMGQAYDEINNYESEYKENDSQKNIYTFKDSEESRQEYLDKHTAKDDLTNGNKVTQFIYDEPINEDYSHDVALEA